MKKNILKSVLLLASFVLLLSCSNQKKEVTDFNQLSEKILKYYNEHDATSLSQLYAEDGVITMSGQAEPIQGRKAIEQSNANFFRAFPDLKLEFVTIVASGDQVCFEFKENGTFSGLLSTPNGDIPPTGKKFEMKGAFFAKVTPDGLISMDRTYYNVNSFASQIGIQ